MELLHKWTTQYNESLKMRLVEVAPKHKNYSRTKVLDCRVNMITGHHNIGHHAYYTSVFSALNLIVDDGLDSWLMKKDKQKVFKKSYDAKPEVK